VDGRVLVPKRSRGKVKGDSDVARLPGDKRVCQNMGWPFRGGRDSPGFGRLIWEGGGGKGV